jgi:transposase-like protein
MEKSQSTLSTWFWGAYLVTTQTPGQSALQFQRQLEIKRYEKAFLMLHKLRAGMVRPERDCIGESRPVEVDECLVGGRTRGEGKGVHHKATVVGAVEVRTRDAGDDKKHKRAIYGGRLRLRMVDGRGSENLMAFVTENVAKGATVKTDGWQGYDGLPALGYSHDPLVLGGDPEKTQAHLPMIHIVFSNLKTWLLGTHHGVSQTHLQAYLNEFVFRFNRRFYPMNAFNSVLGISVRSEAPTYAALYSGEWTHPR